MSTFLAAIASNLARRWKLGLAGVVLGIFIIGFLASALGGTPKDDFGIPGADSQSAYDVLEKDFPAAAGATSTVVFKAEDGTLRTKANEDAIAEVSKEVSALPHVASAQDPLSSPDGTISKDGTVASINVQYDVQQDELEAEDGKKLEEVARTAESPALTVELRGETIDLAAQQEAPVGELVGIFVAFLLLLLLFRSGSAMAVTLFGALTGVLVSQMILAILAKPLGLPEFTPTIAVMLGLGAGIDYALLIVSRFREQLADGSDVPHAAERANATSGTSVVAAGLIVMVALAGMLAIGIPFMGKLGIGAAIAIAAVVVSSITVLPILMGAFSRWLKPKNRKTVDPSPAFGRWGNRVTSHPWIVIGIAVLILLVLSIPLKDLRLGQPDDGNQPTSTTQRRAYDIQKEAFGAGSNGPLLISVSRPGGGKLDESEATAVSDSLNGRDGVQFAAPPEISPNGEAAIIGLVPTTSPQDARTSQLVKDLRDDYIPEAIAGQDLVVHVGGQTAVIDDLSTKIESRLPVFIGIVIGLSVLLLIAVFRSIWVPLASALFNLLVIGAAYGVIVAVFQKGFGAGLIGVGDDVPIIAFAPLMMFAILFGLSMDYNVFLLSRIREAYFEGDTPRESVIDGLARIAKVILIAGLIMASVFLAFIPGGDVISKMFGLGLGVAILIDVLIIRMMVAPALVYLLGDKAWWLPGWLDRILPNVSLEGDHEDRDDKQAARAQEITQNG